MHVALRTVVRLGRVWSDGCRDAIQERRACVRSKQERCMGRRLTAFELFLRTAALVGCLQLAVAYSFVAAAPQQAAGGQERPAAVQQPPAATPPAEPNAP
jgi:hypothetical protein